MKKLIIFVFCFWIYTSIYLNAYSNTGHESFINIEFVDEGRLLINMDIDEINEGFKALGKNRFFGWKHHLLTENKDALYIGEIIFSRTNRTNQKIEFDYSIREVNQIKSSVKTSGSLNPSFSTKVKNKFDIGVRGSFDIKYDTDDSYTKTVDTKFSIVVHPFHRITFRTTGDAYVSNGVSKYYFLGITMKKGSWEYIDIITRYYELFEEKVS